MSTVADYIDRKIDVLGWRGGGLGGNYKLKQSLADEESSGEICTGLQQLAQRFLITFLLEKGSKQYDPDAGTRFMTKIRQGRMRSEADMRAGFALAELEVRGQLIREESNSDPDDERYVKARLASLQLAPGWASLTIELTSRAPRPIGIILPISVVV